MWVDFVDIKRAIKEKGSELQCYWISFIGIAKVLLNLLYTARSRDLHLSLEIIREIIYFPFASKTLITQDI